MVRDTRKAWKVGLLGLEISALVEFSQLIFRVGCFDVDDDDLNTFGALAGTGASGFRGSGFPPVSGGGDEISSIVKHRKMRCPGTDKLQIGEIYGKKTGIFL